MDNNQDQKYLYQVPASQSGEIFDTPVISTEGEPTSNQAAQPYAAIAREDVTAAFNQRNLDLEMSMTGYEARTVDPVEIISPHPVSVQIIQIGAEIKAQRVKYQDSIVASGMFARFLGKVLAKDPSSGVKPSISKILDSESEFGIKQFPKDPDVTDMKFFFWPDGETHKWYHSQVSSVRHKHFTNSYMINEYGIEKSSTFFAESYGREINVVLPVTEAEAQNLLIATKNYYTEATGKVYARKPAARLRFLSKDDVNLAA